jgi:dsDNA-binding SOS-regulon protein
MTKKNDKDDLIGFEELLQDQKKSFLPKPPKSQARESESGLEQLTFLEEDAQRLDKMIDLFDNKLKHSFVQTPHLIEKQRENNQRLKLSILPMITSKNSLFMQTLSELWAIQFKEITKN